MIHVNKHPATMNAVVSSLRRVFSLYDTKKITYDDLVESVLFYKKIISPVILHRLENPTASRIKRILEKEEEECV